MSTILNALLFEMLDKISLVFLFNLLYTIFNVLQGGSGMTLGERLNEYRTEHNLSMQDFAKRAGISKGYVSMIETGVNSRGEKVNPSMVTLRKISSCMGISLTELMQQIDSDTIIVLDSDDISLEKDKHPADSEVLLSQLPEAIQQLVRICVDRPELTSALLSVARQIENEKVVQV